MTSWPVIAVCSVPVSPSLRSSTPTSYSSSAVWMLHHLAMGSGMISHSSLCFSSSLTNVDFPAAAEDLKSSEGVDQTVVSLGEWWL